MFYIILACWHANTCYLTLNTSTIEADGNAISFAHIWS